LKINKILWEGARPLLFLVKSHSGITPAEGPPVEIPNNVHSIYLPKLKLLWTNLAGQTKTENSRCSH